MGHTSASDRNKFLFIVGCILLFIMFIPSIVMSALGLHNLDQFSSDRNAYLRNVYQNTTPILEALVSETSSAISQLEQLTMQLQYGTNNNGSVSMIWEGTLRWQVTSGTSAPLAYDSLPVNSPNSTYRAYVTQVSGISFYVVAIDAPLYNGPITATGSGYKFISVVFDNSMLFDYVGSVSQEIYLPNVLPLLVNTSACDPCVPLPPVLILYLEPTTIYIQQLLFSRSGSSPDIDFTLPSTTRFLFFK